MKHHPMIFPGPMVRAILEGRKTMTRRLNGLKKVNREPNGWAQAVKLNDGSWTFWGPNKVDEKWVREVAYPNGGGFKTYEKGDRIWVRETWQVLDRLDQGNDNYRVQLEYKADIKKTIYKLMSIHCNKRPVTNYQWILPFFMPRWASRITLEIVDVRVERLQHIGMEELHKEGMERWRDYEGGEHLSVVTVRNDFHRYWNSLYKKNPEYQWEKNPWVWAIEFRKL